jgi:hypothetical protein
VIAMAEEDAWQDAIGEYREAAIKPLAALLAVEQA